MSSLPPFARKDADPVAYQALKIGVGFLRLPNTELVSATGTEVVKLLQGLVINDVFKLAEPGSGQLNASVNNVGRLLSLFRILHINDLLLLDLPEGAIASRFVSHLKTHVINEDAKFKDKSAGIEKFVIAGPNSLDLLTNLFKEKSPGIKRQLLSLDTFHALTASISTPNNLCDVICQRLDDLRTIDSFQLIVAKEDADAIESLLRANGASPVPFPMYDYVRLEMLARARWGLELTDDVIPLEGDLNSIVSYNKGCYLGQEIIARLDSRRRFARRLCTIEWDSDGSDLPIGTVNNTDSSPSEPTPIEAYEDPGMSPSVAESTDGDNERKGRRSSKKTSRKKDIVGEIIYAIYCEDDDRHFIRARAYLKRPSHEIGAKVRIGDAIATVVEVAGES